MSLLSLLIRSRVYLGRSRKGVEDVVGQTGQKIDDEPAPEVVESDDPRVGNDLPRRTDERHVEVEHYVNKEDYIDDAVDD